jgi:hypothetical protein
MFFAPFGGAWVALWSYRANGHWELHQLLLAILVSTALLYLAYRRYQLHKPALAAQPDTPEKRKADNMFHIINGGQWVAILIVGNVLANIRLADWVLAAAIFIVGLHFIPLARLFNNSAHYITGCALMLVAVVYPMVAPGGAANPIGCLCAGMILWASAFRAVTIVQS